MKCQNCNRDMNQKDEFCGGCGSKLSSSHTTVATSCPSCMNQMSPNQTHCPKCGSDRNLFTVEDQTQVSAGSSKRSRLPGIIISGIGLAVIIFAFVNFQTTGDALRTDNNPGIGLQHVMSVPFGIVGLVILIAGLFFLRESTQKP